MRKLVWLAAALIAGALVPGAPAAAESNGGVRVMPLGDSITEGTQVPGGYRIGLWQRVSSGGYQVDFVGSQANGPASLGDHDHEGHPGWRIDQIDANIVPWLRATTPHTVLLHIGTNDVLQNYDVARAPARLSGLIDHITATAPDAEVFVAMITPLGNAGQDSAARTFNSAIPGIVQNNQNAGKHVHLVDMHSALTAAELIDGIHPTAGGYDKMAATWFTALQSVAREHRHPRHVHGETDRRRPVRPLRGRAESGQRHAGAAAGLRCADVDAHREQAADHFRDQVPGRVRPGHRRRHRGDHLGLQWPAQPAVEPQRRRHDHRRAVRPVPRRDRAGHRQRHQADPVDLRGAAEPEVDAALTGRERTWPES